MSHPGGAGGEKMRIQARKVAFVVVASASAGVLLRADDSVSTTGDTTKIPGDYVALPGWEMEGDS